MLDDQWSGTLRVERMIRHIESCVLGSCSEGCVGLYVCLELERFEVRKDPGWWCRSKIGFFGASSVFIGTNLTSSFKPKQ